MQAISPSGIESAQAGQWHSLGKAGEPAEGDNVEHGRHHSSRLDAAVGGAQVGPIDLGAHFLAAHGAGGQAFDARAVFDRDAGRFPLAHGARRDAHHGGENSLASKVLRGAVNWVHAISLDALDYRCQGGLNHFFLGGLIFGEWTCAIESENCGAGTA